jgi:hypothetical protein
MKYILMSQYVGESGQLETDNRGEYETASEAFEVAFELNGNCDGIHIYYVSVEAA